MNETYTSLLTGLISGAITAVVTYFATLAKAAQPLPQRAYLPSNWFKCSARCTGQWTTLIKM